MNYTERIDGFQITDVTYLGRPPENAPIKFDIVKWVTDVAPYEAYNMKTGLKEIHTEYCFVVIQLIWDKGEDCFDLNSIGLRWLEEKPTEAVIEAVLKFCSEKGRELMEEDGW